MQYEMDEDLITSRQGPEVEHWPAPQRQGVDPAEYAYDLLCRDEGTGFIYLPILNYADGNLDFLKACRTR
jgi:N-acyl-D-amino-acid deacylase